MRHLLFVCAVACAPSLCAADPQYAVRDLGISGRPTAINNNGQIVVVSPGPGSDAVQTFVLDGTRTVSLPAGTEGYGINNRGQVVGWYSAGGVRSAFVWENNALRTLPTLGGNHAGANAINDPGDIVGYAANRIVQVRAALWGKQGSVTELGPFTSLPASWDPSTALAINARGQVVGYWLNDGSMTVSFLWENGVYKHIFNPLNPQHPMVTVAGINNSGDITGYTGDWHECPKAFLIDKGTTFKLLPIPEPTRPHAINNSGSIAGERWISCYDRTYRAFVYDGQDMVLLPLLPGHTQSVAWAMNDRGDVVGTSDGRAVIWEKLAQPNAPSIVPIRSGNLGALGWYTSNVRVVWEVTDALSGIARTAGCNPVLYTAETRGTVLSCSATNGAGVPKTVSLTVKIDKNAPAIWGMPGPGCSVPPFDTVTRVATVTASDGVSGVAGGSFTVWASGGDSSDVVIKPTATGGFEVYLRGERQHIGRTYKVYAQARDLAGNTATAQSTCTVGR